MRGPTISSGILCQHAKEMLCVLIVVGLPAVPRTAALAGDAAPAAWELRLTVTEPAGLARRSKPVSGGIPLMAAAFQTDQGFALFDENGAEVPLQASPLVVDEKGNLQWVLLDFQTDLAAGETKAFTLRAGEGAAAPPKPLRVTRPSGGVAVDTGAVAVTIAADKPFSLFTTATVGGRPVVSGGEVSYTDGLDGTRYVADRPASIEVEYAGPLRTTLCVRGGFAGDALCFVVRSFDDSANRSAMSNLAKARSSR